MKIQEFTPTDFRANSSVVFNKVQESGQVKIVSKSRPVMILLTQKKLDAMLADASFNG